MESLTSLSRIEESVICLLQKYGLDSIADMIQHCSLVLYLPLVRSELAKKYSYFMDPEMDISVFFIPNAKNLKLPCVVCGDGRCFILDPVKLKELVDESPWLIQDLIAPPPSPLLQCPSDKEIRACLDTLSLYVNNDEDREGLVASTLMTRTLLITP